MDPEERMILYGAAAAVSLALFAGMLACLEGGYRMGARHSRSDPQAHEGIHAIEAAVFALLGLLLGFAFAGATARLDARRQLIVQEANAVGTAYHMLDALPATEQHGLRLLFRDYLSARLRVYAGGASRDTMDARITRANRIQEELWDRAVEAARLDPTQNATRLLLPAIVGMMDVTTARTV